MGRSPCCSKVGLRRGPWSTKEDTILANYIQQHGEGQWRSLPKNAGLLRCGKSCRLRWMNYLRPGIKRGNISEDEEDLIVRLHKLLGNRWSLIAGRLPGRTDNEIKNHWNTHLLKKLHPANKIIFKNNNKKKQEDKQGEGGIINTTTNFKKEEEVVVHLPKPIRLVSSSTSTSTSISSSGGGGGGPMISRTNSYDSFSSSDHHHDFIFQHQHDEAVNMWEKVYHEYFQLL